MSRSVLVVEDDAHIRAGMIALMRTRGHRAVGTASVTEALARLEELTTVAPVAPAAAAAVAAAAPLSHVFLDLNLPDGCGTDVLRVIRQRSLPLRVALLTGASDAALLAEARALGVEAVFVKPADWDLVLDWVDAAAGAAP